MSASNNLELNQWLEMLRSPDVNDRIVAVKTLQHLGDDETIDALIIALKDEHITVQKIAISALWEIANPVAIPALIECLSSADPISDQPISSSLAVLRLLESKLLIISFLLLTTGLMFQSFPKLRSQLSSSFEL